MPSGSLEDRHSNAGGQVPFMHTDGERDGESVCVHIYINIYIYIYIKATASAADPSGTGGARRADEPGVVFSVRKFRAHPTAAFMASKSP